MRLYSPPTPTPQPPWQTNIGHKIPFGNVMKNATLKLLISCQWLKDPISFKKNNIKINKCKVNKQTTISLQLHIIMYKTQAIQLYANRVPGKGRNKCTVQKMILCVILDKAIAFDKSQFIFHFKIWLLWLFS